MKPFTAVAALVLSSLTIASACSGEDVDDFPPPPVAPQISNPSIAPPSQPPETEFPTLPDWDKDFHEPGE